MRGNFIPPLYSGPLSWLPPGWDYGDPDYYSELLLSEDVHYLLVAQPYDPDASAVALGLGPPLLRKPLGWSPYFRYRGRSVPVYLSDHHGFISHATDMPPSEPFPAVLETVYGIEIGIGGMERDRLAPGSVSFGDAVIKNGTGERDRLTNYSWGGQRVEVKAGLEGWPLSRYATVLMGNVIPGTPRANDDRIHIGLASRDGILDTPLTRAYYDGAGGAGGPAQLAGLAITLVLGRCRNVGMLQLDAALQIWRVGEQLGAVLAVRNRGLAVDDSGFDYPTYEALAAASIPPGEYATCLALGLIRFGSNVTIPTADVDGPAEWGENATRIVEYLLRNRIGRFNLSTSEIDGANFTATANARDWRVGIVVDAETDLRPVSDRLLRSIGAWMLPNRRGVFQVGLYARPTSTTATITSAEVDDAGPELAERWRAVRRLTLAYKPMWRVMAGTDLSEEVTAGDRNLLSRPFRTIDQQRSVADRDAIDYQVSTDLDDPDDAETLAAILADLLAWGTHIWRVPLRTLPLRHAAGARRAFAYPRHGLANGVNTLALRVVESDQSDNQIWLWGSKP